MCALRTVGHPLHSYCFSLPSLTVAVSKHVILRSHRFASVSSPMEHFFVYTKIRRVVLERKCYFCAGLSQSTNRNNQTNQQRNKQTKKTHPVRCWLLKHSGKPCGTGTGTTNRLTERNSRCRCEPWDLQTQHNFTGLPAIDGGINYSIWDVQSIWHL